MKSYQNPSHLAVVLSETDIQSLLLGRMKTAALSLVVSLFEQDAERLCGSRFSHKTGGKFRRGGSEKTSVVISGAKHPIRKPRVRSDEGEVQLPSYQTLKSGDILDDRMLSHMIHGVSTRNYEKVSEEYADRFGTSKSAVSRAFVRSSQKDLDQINGSDLSTIRFVGLMLDGIEFAGRVMLVALGIDTEGSKTILGVRDGSSENQEVVKDLLESLITRGFTPNCDRLLVCLDGSKALKTGVIRVFGDKAIIQRCYLHKIRNLKSYLREEDHAELVRRMRLIMTLNDFTEAKKEQDCLQTWLESKNTQAANSLKEVEDDLLTLHRLGIKGGLRKSLASTNLIESVFSAVRSKCSRVKNWKTSPSARMRWVASAAIAHQPKMRKVRGVAEIKTLMEFLNKVEKVAEVG